MVFKEINLALVKAEAGKHTPTRQFLFEIHAAIDLAQHAFTLVVLYIGETCPASWYAAIRIF
jgi:hypothetical protein